MTNNIPRRTLFVKGTRLEADDAVVRAVAACPGVNQPIITVPKSQHVSSSLRDVVISITRSAGGLVRGNRSLVFALDACVYQLDRKGWPIIHLRGETGPQPETANVLSVLLRQGARLIISNQNLLPIFVDDPQIRRRARFVLSAELTPGDIASICEVADER